MFFVTRPPKIEDIQNLPYVMATLMEIQRRGVTAPASLPHYLMKDTTVNGFKFKKGTLFIANLSKYLMDPEIFPSPKNFDPERFLDENGKIKRNEQFAPFSIGKRICMGESLAKNELFLFFVRMLQRISFQETKNKLDPENAIMGVTRFPKPFEVKVILK